MNFCPNCENLLYYHNGKLFCKVCNRYYELYNDESKSSLNLNNLKKESSNSQTEDLNDMDSKTESSEKIDFRTFFPYGEFRKDQEKIINDIELAAQEKKNILLVAPNGSGKTIIALSALLSLAIQKNLKIIYLCRTHSQNSRVIKELYKISTFLNAKHPNLKVNGLSIRGRNEMCLNKTLLSLKLNPRESMAVCTDLRKNRNCSYFLNLLKKRDQVDNPTHMSPDLFNKPVDAGELIKFCEEKKLCPYFLSKFLLKEMRLIICNYQWIFHPFIRENFLAFIERDIEDCILVLDECHNIIDMATEINSDSISPYSLRLCLRDLELYRSPIIMQNFTKILLNHLEKKKQQLTTEEKEIDASNFLFQVYTRLGLSDLNSFSNFLKELLEFNSAIHDERIANGEVSKDYLGSLAEFWLKWIRCLNMENYFFCYTNKNIKERKVVFLEIVALDPREVVIPILKSCYTSLHLSGTVNPYVYNNLVGLQETGKSFKGIVADSPFKKENIKAIITEGVDTNYQNRVPSTYKKMISKIDEIVAKTPANVGIFCASYTILKELLSNGLETVAINNNKQLFIEESGLSASENALLVNEFKSMAVPPYKGAILLGVCGGRNSEGEDYPGPYMNAVVIAGFPYHLPTPRTEAKIKYYDKVFNKQGWNFAYLYPAIQRANQASGRPIRKLKDKGVIIFMDSRFKQKYKWISEWIRNELEIAPDNQGVLSKMLSHFW